ncbi:hypothetical protein [Pedobacter cryoconitis]|uniref:Uncharacterized protein n=1 Tax=Pedobacter cryoconitis TaxID=188932 RepID=A0A327SK44_9SPHI|nr:hypothetical protein [Pedobacter cryoconitis]RAJ28885.1 hypothetical protein LY11_03159 [Pedobacter cryoconitis]
MNEILLSILTGLISGVISSLLFFWIISRMRPKMSISTAICKGVDSVGTFYGFKILNNSKYNVLDLKIEVILKKPFNSNGGANHSNVWIELKRDGIIQFPRYRKDDKSAGYALIVATRDNLDALWCDDAQSLEVIVHGKHSFSGISKSFTQNYYTKKSCIKEGIFNFGQTFEIS